MHLAVIKSELEVLLMNSVAGSSYGGYDNPKLTYSKSVKMWQGSNKISILSSAVGLAVS
jgi:hypothetical protein